MFLIMMVSAIGLFAFLTASTAKEFQALGIGPCGRYFGKVHTTGTVACFA